MMKNILRHNHFLMMKVIKNQIKKLKNVNSYSQMKHLKTVMAILENNFAWKIKIKLKNGLLF